MPRPDSNNRNSSGRKRSRSGDSKPFNKKSNSGRSDNASRPTRRSAGSSAGRREGDFDKKPRSSRGTSGDAERGGKKFSKGPGSGFRKSSGQSSGFDRDKKYAPRGGKRYGDSSEGRDDQRKSYGKREGGDKRGGFKSSGFDRDKKYSPRGGKGYGDSSEGQRDDRRKSYGRRDDGDKRGGFKSSGFDRDKKYAPRGGKRYGDSFGDEQRENKRKSYGRKDDGFNSSDGAREKKYTKRSEEFGEEKRSSSGPRKRSDADDKEYSAPKRRASESSGDDKPRGNRRTTGQSPRERRQDERETRGFFNKTKTAAKSDSRDGSSGDEATGEIRLNRYIANSGICSRREADELIKMGLVSVNGNVVTEMGYKVKPGEEVRYENRVLRAEKPVYILLNKPKGYLTTTDDPQERNTVMHLIHGVKERIYPVGRLDRNTTGLLLLTNDGDLADKLMHPSYNVKKIYKVELDKPLTKNDFQKILEGVRLEEGRATVDDLAIVSDDGRTVGVEIHIGWNRVVRRIFEALEYTVVKLDRSVYAGLDKKDLGRGEWRFLKKEEIIRLKHFK